MSTPVGVLLPIRIETAFDPHPGGCRLRVIVVPDAPWIDRHDETVRPSELEALDAAWNDSGGNFDSEDGRRVFTRFASGYGGARAAWLARRFPALLRADGTFVADRTGARPRAIPRGSVIRDLPPRIELWAARVSPPAGVPPMVRLASLTPTSDALRVELDEDAVAQAGERIFQPSWQAARDAGLTADLELAALGLDPNDIDVLYAIGLGNTDPSGLFTAHRDAGLLAICAPESPTNTVAGTPAADLGQDAARWVRTLRAAQTGDEEGLISITLTGQADALGPIYGPDRSGPADPLPPEPHAVLSHDDRGRMLVSALWPALWGSNLKDIWGIDPADPEFVQRLGLWALTALRPEGPLPPIRIGNQPYGLVPATSLQRWDGAGDVDDVEAAMRPHLIGRRAWWARRAEAAGTIEGADADRVLTLLERTPVSARLMSTLHIPLEVLAIGLSAIAPPHIVRQWWQKQAELPIELRGGTPDRAFVQTLAPRDLQIPLVEPTRPEDPESPWFEEDGRTLFARAMHTLSRRFRAGLTPSYFDLARRSELPRSVLFRLIVHGALLAASEVVRTGKGLRGPIGAGEGRLLDRFGGGASVTDLPGTLANALFRAMWRTVDRLADEDPRVLERGFLATLDTASYRLDPWITGVAWRRLNSNDYRAERRWLGAYGWVDRPFRGTRGPTRAGLLLAPSAAQANAAVILRDKAVYDPQPAAGALPGTRRWDMTLDSARVRLANQIAAEVRIGAHIGEVLGREMERIFPARQDVDVLRAVYQLHSANQGRRVCDGQKALARTAADFAADTGLVARPDQERRMRELRETIDVYGDLLVADAVFDVVSGRGETASAAMDAAAGLELPPEIDVIRTPRAGKTVSTLLVGALPTAAGPAPANPSPVWLAEPALAAYVAATFPPASQWQWTREDRTVSGAGAESISTTAVSLADLDLEPVDLIVLTPEHVAGLVVQVTSDAVATVQPRVRPTGTGPDLHARLRQLLATLKGSPALPTRIAADAHEIDRAEDQAVGGELWARLQDVRDEATSVRDALTASAGAVVGMNDGDTELLLARRWGVIAVAPADVIDPVERRRGILEQAAKTFDERLEKAPPSGAAPPASATAETIAAAIGALVAPGEGLPIFARIRRSQLGARAAGPSTLTPEPSEPMPLPGHPGGGLNRLDRTWLTVVAAVRGAAARVESYQLHALTLGWPALRASTNWPANPWRQNVAQPPGGAPPDALIAVYAPALALDGAADPTIAAIVLDSWTETIPAADHTVAAAFGFNAPAARAPQAILIAVPPVDGVPLDLDTLRDIVAETRELAHARMATPQDLQPLAAALPFSLVESRYADLGGVELEPWERA